MSVIATGVVLAVAVTVFGVCAVMARRPYEPGRIWRVPYTALMWLSVLVAVLMLAHLVTLLTGTPLRSRFGF